MSSELSNLINESKLQREEITKLTIAIRDLEKVCSRMNNHITFVENVYETVKAPANYILSKISTSETKNRLE